MQDHRFEQGFSIRVNKEITSFSKKLSFGGFSYISFRGKYPIGKVTYKDNDIPVTAKLEAFSPFIPTNYEKSDFPAVVMQYKIKNTKGKHINRIINSDGILQLVNSSKAGVEGKKSLDYGNMSLSLLDANKNSWASPKVVGDVDYNSVAVSPSKEIKASADLGDVYRCYRSKITFKGK